MQYGMVVEVVEHFLKRGIIRPRLPIQNFF